MATPCGTNKKLCFFLHRNILKKFDFNPTQVREQAKENG